MYRKVAFVVIAFTVGVASLFYFQRDNFRPVNTETTSQELDTTSHPARRAENEGFIESGIDSENQFAAEDLSSPQLVRSIHESDKGVREAAQHAAENFVKNFEVGQLLRWEPVRISPYEFLNGSYLKQGSVPRMFEISLFRNLNFVVSETKYEISEHIAAATWTGVIGGNQDSRVEIGIVGGIDQPGFLIKIAIGTQRFSVQPTDTRDIYVAMEINPNGPTPAFQLPTVLPKQQRVTPDLM